ncbi:MAG TPA: FCD domain-containing protein [Streptosporangiaceae bacterium]|nr:FCD domain-containing protein [Streptosporangiaceae bacterium]
MSYASPSSQVAQYPGLSPRSVRTKKDLTGQPGHLARSDGTGLRPAPETRDRAAMTEDTLISLQSAATRIACQRMTAQHLSALHASVEQASCLSARPDWRRKATAHAELFNLLCDSTGDPALALLVGSATGWLHDLLMAVGPRADGIILSSRRRLLRHLKLRDADGAAREMEHHLTGLRYMGRLARGTISDTVTVAS